jgi:hypothetical protein
VQRVRQRERAKREVQLDLVALPLGEDAHLTRDSAATCV